MEVDECMMTMMELKVRLGVQITQLPVGKVAVGMTTDGVESEIGCCDQFTQLPIGKVAVGMAIDGLRV